MTSYANRRLYDIFMEHGVLRGDFTLSSGEKSSYYFDGRMVSLHPEGACLIGKIIYDIILPAGAEAVGGMTLGADPIATAVAVVSYLEDNPISAFIVRDSTKCHGTKKLVEGHLHFGSCVAIVDDVVTTGWSMMNAIETVEKACCAVVAVVALLDRQQGGSEEIKKRGYEFRSILTADSSGNVRLSEE